MPTKISRLSFRPIQIAEALAAGIEDLAEENFSESGFQGFPFLVNWPAYHMAERRGELLGVGAFCKGVLVGYAAYFLWAPIQHKTSLWAYNSVVFMAKEHRGYGSLELMAEGEAQALKRGAQAVVQAVPEGHSTSDKRSASLGELLSRKGYVPYERQFVKVLKDR